ncbi:MAG: alpha/beta hydrolase [Syntrophobacterales bacterium]|jgi:pimeloyl-ACP methyl ester carboxylesterase|nr:alpha/beta hydrolase [Syntrophobacterales bacterium]
MSFEKINGLNIYYEVHGEGETIMLLHHGFGCSKIWKKVCPALVDQGYRVVMFDRRGFGQSDRGGNFQEFYESDRYRTESVEELKAIKDTLGINKCHIVGQCEGGVVGVDYSVKYPGEVMTLTTSSTQCYSEIPMTELNSLKLVNTYRDLAPALQARMIEWHGEEFAEWNYNQFAKSGGEYGTGLFDLRPILPFVPCPTLVIYPDRSSIFDVEQSIAFYRNLIKGELAVFPKCGHNTYDQRPDDYIRAIVEFIARITKGKESREGRPEMTCLA